MYPVEIHSALQGETLSIAKIPAGVWRNQMLAHESRVQEIERLKAMGVAALKTDFFGGDLSSQMTQIQPGPGKKPDIIVKSHGGFVLVCTALTDGFIANKTICRTGSRRLS
jgi:hypothetical protein